MSVDEVFSTAQYISSPNHRVTNACTLTTSGFVPDIVVYTSLSGIMSDGGFIALPFVFMATYVPIMSLLVACTEVLIDTTTVIGMLEVYLTLLLDCTSSNLCLMDPIVDVPTTAAGVSAATIGVTVALLVIDKLAIAVELIAFNQTTPENEAESTSPLIPSNPTPFQDRLTVCTINHSSGIVAFASTLIQVCNGCVVTNALSCILTLRFITARSVSSKNVTPLATAPLNIQLGDRDTVSTGQLITNP